ncbi:hypothetical protein H8959_011420 [Pygathrix nigripes]
MACNEVKKHWTEAGISVVGLDLPQATCCLKHSTSFNQTGFFIHKMRKNQRTRKASGPPSGAAGRAPPPPDPPPQPPGLQQPPDPPLPPPLKRRRAPKGVDSAMLHRNPLQPQTNSSSSSGGGSSSSNSNSSISSSSFSQC